MIILKKISKSLQGKSILNNISVHISKNESIGIIGLNGAGKTTLLNVIAGFLEPDSGFLRVGDAEVVFENRQILKSFSFVSGNRAQLWEDIRIKDSFAHCVKMYGIAKSEAEKRLKELDEVFEINSFLESVPQSLSLGERIRCELAYALLSAPKILMLDEALIGLDVSVKHKIMEYLEQIKRSQKTTMIYTSHNLLEIEKLCDRILLIDQGRIIFDGTVERMMQDFSPLYHMEMVIGEKLPDFEDLPLEKVRITNNSLHIVYDKQKIDTTQILTHIMEQTEVLDAQMFEPNLEETIKKIYERTE